MYQGYGVQSTHPLYQLIPRPGITVGDELVGWVLSEGLGMSSLVIGLGLQ